VEDLRILSAQGPAIATTGSSGLCVERVALGVELGDGIFSEGTDAVHIVDTEIRGPVTEATVSSTPLEPTPETAARYGVLAQCGSELTLRGSTVGGWALGGVSVIGGRATIEESRVFDFVGTGILLAETSAELRDVEIHDAYQATRLVPTYGLVTADGSFESEGLHVHDIEGYGALHSGGEAAHSGAEISGNYSGGIWAQESDVRIERSLLTRNGASAVVSYSGFGLEIVDTELRETRPMTRIFETTPIEVESGLLVRGHFGPLALENVDFVEDGEWAVLLMLGIPHEHPVELRGVTLSPGSNFGVAGGPLPTGWEEGVSPSEAAMTIADDGTSFIRPFEDLPPERGPPVPGFCP
jgi:hypothetical protein